MSHFMSEMDFDEEDNRYSLMVCSTYIRDSDMLSLYERAIVLLESMKHEIDESIDEAKKIIGDIKLDVQFSNMGENDQIQIISTDLNLGWHSAKKLLYICNKKTMAEVKRMYRYLDVECTIDNLNVAYDIVKYKEKPE